MAASRLKLYYRALKPERTYANILTTVAGFLFASSWHIDWLLLCATLGGTTLVVMSGCAANNCTDRGVDVLMPRTRTRATATGALRLRNVALLAVALGLAGFIILALFVNWLTWFVGLVAYIDYVVLYAWSKRTTPHSTLVGTVAGAAPLVAGYTAVTGVFDITALLLGLMMVFWQMVHFYAIGIFRAPDYAAAKLPVWTVRYGARNTQLWMLAYTVLFVVSVLVLAAVAHLGGLFTVSMGTLGLYWLVRGVAGLWLKEPEPWARSMFGYSLVVLVVMSVALAGTPLLG